MRHGIAMRFTTARRNEPHAIAYNRIVSHERAQGERRADIWRRKTVPAKVGGAVGSIVWHLESSAEDCIEHGSSAQYPNRRPGAAHMTHATLL